MKEIQGKSTLVQVSKGSSYQELTVCSGLKNRDVYFYIQISAAVSVKIRKSGPLSHFSKFRKSQHGVRTGATVFH